MKNESFAEMYDPRQGSTQINSQNEAVIIGVGMIQELFPRTIVMDDRQVLMDGRTKDILEIEELLTAHGLEKP